MTVLEDIKKQIEAQIEGLRKEEVDEIIIEQVKIGKFTPEIKKLFE